MSIQYCVASEHSFIDSHLASCNEWLFQYLTESNNLLGKILWKKKGMIKKYILKKEELVMIKDNNVKKDGKDGCDQESYRRTSIRREW